METEKVLLELANRITNLERVIDEILKNMTPSTTIAMDNVGSVTSNQSLDVVEEYFDKLLAKRIGKKKGGFNSMFG